MKRQPDKKNIFQMDDGDDRVQQDLEFRYRRYIQTLRELAPSGKHTPYLIKYGEKEKCRDGYT